MLSYDDRRRRMSGRCLQPEQFKIRDYIIRKSEERKIIELASGQFS